MGAFKFKENDIITHLRTYQLEYAMNRDRFCSFMSKDATDAMQSLGINIMYDDLDLIKFKLYLERESLVENNDEFMDDDYDE